MLVLVGIEDADSQEDIQWLSGKIVNLRIFGDENDVMNLSVKDIDGDIIVVSQFTLQASTKKAIGLRILKLPSQKLPFHFMKKSSNKSNLTYRREFRQACLVQI